MVLFYRDGEKFFACSAYRDRKQCNAYCLHEQWIRKGKVNGDNLHGNQRKNQLQHQLEKFNKIRLEILPSLKLAKEKQRTFCSTCSVLIEKGHEDHQLITEISDNLLQFPSRVQKPNSSYVYKDCLV